MEPSNGSRARKWCSDACRKAAGRAAPVGRPVGAEPGPIETTLRTVLAEVRFPEGDPRLVLAQVALRIAQALDQRPTAPLSNELKGLVTDIVTYADDPPGIVDELKARRAVRRLDGLLAWPADGS